MVANILGSEIIGNGEPRFVMFAPAAFVLQDCGIVGAGFAPMPFGDRPPPYIPASNARPLV